MTFEDEDRQTRVAETLKSACDGIKVIPDRSKSQRLWHFQYENGSTIHGIVRTTPEWIFLTGNLESVENYIQDGSPMRFTRLNAWLPGMLKVCIGSQGTIQLAAEIPEGEGMCSEQRLLETARGFGTISKSLGSKAISPYAPADMEPGRSDKLFALCEEAGWRCHQRKSGTVVVDLEGAGTMVEAKISPILFRGARVCSELAQWGPDPLEDATEKALALFLLRASHVSRMVRMTVDQDDSGWRACCEVQFSDADPSPQELDRALNALEVGDSMVRKEVEALVGSLELATEYVRLFTAGEDNGK